MPRRARRRREQWFVYMLRCAPRGALYAGRTTDVARRFAMHRAGTGAKFTRAFRPVAIAWVEGGHDARSSGRREAAVKRLTRAAKLALCARWRRSRAS